MIKIVSVLLLTFTVNVYASKSRDYQIDDETWEINLLLDNCREKLDKAISTITEKAEYKGYVAILPERIGYEYFTVTFTKESSDSNSDQKNSIVAEFHYLQEVDDGKVSCSRVEFHDFSY